MFLLYRTQEFETNIKYLNNVTEMTINKINWAVAGLKANNFCGHVLLIVLTLITIQSCYCVFKICFKPSNNAKSLKAHSKRHEKTNSRLQKAYTTQNFNVRYKKGLEMPAD
jgi:hypothetical protein